MKVQDIARVIGAQVKGDPDRPVRGAASLETAGPDDISLYLGGKYKKVLEKSKAGALVVNPGAEIEGFTLLAVERPRLAFIEVVKLFHPERRKSGIHPRAAVSDSAVLGKEVFAGAFACIGDRARIGDGTEIHEGTVIYEDVRIGRNCRIYASVIIREGTEIGDNVIIHAGSVIGADGFGFEADEQGRFRKIPQVGRVVIEDDVELGANACIDRAALGETRIGRGTKIDNLCQIGHGTRIGSDTVISGLSGISGSVTIGSHVVMGGGTGIADHITIGDGVMMAGRTGVGQDVPAGSIIAGMPHTDIKTWRRAMISLYNLAKKNRPGTGEEGGV